MDVEVEPIDQDACHVFALGSCQPPRNIGIGCPDGVIYAHVPVLYRGSLHWHLEQRRSGSSPIMVFDTMSESFRQMTSPVHCGISLLFEMNGMLALYNFNDPATIIDIWVSQDYQGEVWAFKCRVELPIEEIRVQFQIFDSNWDMVVTSTDADVLVLVRFGEWLLHINIDGKLVTSFHRARFNVTHLRLKQTLVPHTFFPTPHGYILNGSPFI
jgi:hypothetical protein